MERSLFPVTTWDRSDDFMNFFIKTEEVVTVNI